VILKSMLGKMLCEIPSNFVISMSPSRAVQVNLLLLRCGNIVPLTVRSLDMTMFTTLNFIIITSFVYTLVPSWWLEMFLYLHKFGSRLLFSNYYCYYYYYYYYYYYWYYW
jgi:hypothetical protein